MILLLLLLLLLLLDSSVQYSNCTDDDVQLVNGPSPNEGTLQICRNGVWGVLCYNRYSLTINQAVCNELGFQTEGNLSKHLLPPQTIKTFLFTLCSFSFRCLCFYWKI